MNAVHPPRVRLSGAPGNDGGTVDGEREVLGLVDEDVLRQGLGVGVSVRSSFEERVSDGV